MATEITDPVLAVAGLQVAYQLGGAWLPALNDVSLRIAPMQTVGLVGESGSGKSTFAQAVMGYLSANGRVTAGSVRVEGQEMVGRPARELRQVWGAKLSMVPQDPLTALNPSIRVGEQIAEIARRHEGASRRAAHARAIEMLGRVKIADPERVARRYPHQLSGGMQQRILLAMALSSTDPRLLILDEPTTSLDVTTEAAILDLFEELKANHPLATLFVTHNLGVVARMCDRVTVLYGGEVMEDAPKAAIFAGAGHPYTRLLLQAIPRIGAKGRNRPLQAIPGQIEALGKRGAGCAFANRCPLAIEICHQIRPPLAEIGAGHAVRCHRWAEIDLLPMPSQTPPADSAPTPAAIPDGPPALIADSLRASYVSGAWPRRQTVRAVDGISLSVPKGVTVGLVGESGSGKTTFSRALIGLVEIDSGAARLLEMPLRGRAAQRGKAVQRAMQMVFQHPEESLNPYRTIGQTLRRPLIRLAGLPPDQADQRVRELLAAVNLAPEYAARYPTELSGGEKQRVAIARAFAAAPALIICDEPVSALDVSVQAAVLNLLRELQDKTDAAYLFISHDLAVVGYLADVIAVIYLGELVEVGDSAGFFRPPYHPYTEALISSIPRPDLDGDGRRIRLDGDVPSPAHPPTGCRFHTRCPRRLGEVCITTAPPWQTDAEGRAYRCHIPPDELARLQTGPESTRP